MSSRFDTTEYVKSLTVAGLARAQANAEHRAAPPQDAATLADLEQLKTQIDQAIVRAESELKRFRLLTLAGILMLCATILLLHFSRT